MRIPHCAAAALLLAVPAWADEKPRPAEQPTYAIPYKLTFTNHVMVRVKLNGKGPFNFIVDTGAPALFVATKVAKKVGAEAGKDGWGTFDKLELEGGLVINNAQGRIEDPFQLEGMNGMGLAGIELHGMLGYNLLARYKITYDFTSDKLGLTPLKDFKPAPVPSFGKGGQGGLEAIGTLMKFIGPLMGFSGPPVRKPRGFLGLELDESKDAVTVKSVLPGSPAAKAGIMAGDKLVNFTKSKVETVVDVEAQAAKRSPGDTVVLTIERGGSEKKITLELGKGL